MRSYALFSTSLLITSCLLSAAMAATSPAPTRRAVVLGATGATGRQVVRTLLDRNWSVKTISRRHFDYFEDSSKDPENISHLTEHLVSDMKSLTVEDFRQQDALFNCLGTTRSQAGSAEAFIEFEVGLTDYTASIAKEAGIRHVGVVSAQGANKDAWVPTTAIHPMLYIRTLGEKEEAIINKSFPSLSIFQPGMLDRLVGDRTAENIFVWLVPFMALKVDALALAMVKDAETQLGAMPSDTSQCAVSVPRYVTGNDNIRAISTAE